MSSPSVPIRYEMIEIKKTFFIRTIKMKEIEKWVTKGKIYK